MLLSTHGVTKAAVSVFRLHLFYPGDLWIGNIRIDFDDHGEGAKSRRTGLIEWQTSKTAIVLGPRYTHLSTHSTLGSPANMSPSRSARPRSTLTGAAPTSLAWLQTATQARHGT